MKALLQLDYPGLQIILLLQVCQLALLPLENSTESGPEEKYLLAQVLFLGFIIL
jgi:hypothetical protein